MIPGVEEIQLKTFWDRRGSLVKLPEADFEEEFYTISGEAVLRGLHAQAPPAQTSKLICCLHGAVLDVLLDLRTDSPAFGEVECRNFFGTVPEALLIPEGVAHGFLVITAPAIMLYRQSRRYSPEHDVGVRWDSAGITWPCCTPVLSERDAALPALKDFKSPFRL